ncbi:MAG: hypothetical protein R6T92_07960, partial [Desulfosalsimonadaceae bacterium]
MLHDVFSLSSFLLRGRDRDGIQNNLKIKVCVLARTQIPDIEAAIEVSQKASVPVEVIIIVGSSK